MTAGIIDVFDVSVIRGGASILKSVNLEVHKGDSLSIIGPNGAGKTTLLKCMNRLITPQSGSIEIQGHRQDELNQKDLAKIIGYVPQSDGNVLPFTAFEFVLMSRYPHLSPFASITKEDKDVAYASLEKTGTIQFADRPLDTLSGGERQQIMIAAALAQGAEVLLLDEPATFLDYRHQVSVSNLLKELHTKESLTLVTVTHDINVALQTSTRIAALKEGEKIFDDTPEILLASDDLETIFDTSFESLPQTSSSMPWLIPQDTGHE
jgi:iron complex transport system ATP-binding protein